MSYSAPPPASASSGTARAVSGVLAVLAVIALHATYLVFVTTQQGQRVEELAFQQSQHGRVIWMLGRPVLNVVSVAFVALGVLGIMTICVIRRRWALALQVAVLIGGANLTTQLLKDFVYHRPALLPGFAYSNSLPSGHTTVAASVSAALLIAVPRSFRPAAAVFGVVWTAITGVSTLAGRWHRPSDVVASLLVVLAWALGVCAFGSRTTRDEPALDGVGAGAEPTLRGSYWTAAILGVVGLAAGAKGTASLISLWRDPTPPPDAGTGSWLARIFTGGDLVAFDGATLGIIGVTLVSFAVLLLVRQRTARPGNTR